MKKQLFYLWLSMVLVMLLLKNDMIAQNNSKYSPTASIKVQSNSYSERNVLVRLPEEYARTMAHYPVIYILDAHDQSKFDFYCQSIDLLVANQYIPPMIIVGILPNNAKRNYELTPTSTNPKHKSYGGADIFLNHLEKELLPEIDGTYRTNNFRILSGHSFGGLFSIYTLLKKSNLFSAYIAISPTLWYNNEQYITELSDFCTKNNNLKKFFFFSVGNDGDTEENIYTGVEKTFQNLKKCSNKDLKWQYLELNGKNHATTPMFSFSEALTFIFGAWRIPNTLVKAIKNPKNPKDPLTTFNEHKAQVEKIYQVDFDWSIEDYTYLMALPTLDKGNPLKADAILKEAENIYPQASFIDECRGDIAVQQQDWTKASAFFEKALHKLQPNEMEFREALLLKIKVAKLKNNQQGNE